MRVVFLIVAQAAVLCAQIPVVTTIAGASGDSVPLRGFAGDDGPALSATLALANVQNECDPARFEQNSHLFVTSAGELYFADSNNHRIRRISADGIITTVAGSGERPATNARCEATSGIGDGGPAREARLYAPSSVVMLPNGNLVLADQQNNRIRQVTPAGIISTIAGSGAHNLYAPGIPATASPMDWPGALAVDAEGQIYFSELHGNRIGRINSNGRLSTIAGNGFPGSGGDGSQATSAQLRHPAGIAIDRNGTLYIADTGNHRIRKVTGGVITTIAGTGSAGFLGDGEAAVNAALDSPMDVKVDSRGNVYIADTGNHRVRRVTADGVIATIAGTGEPARGADYTSATESSLNSPSALAVDPNDDLFVVDWQNYQIRKIALSGLPAITEFPTLVAPGSRIVIQGLNFGTTDAAVDQGAWPVELGGVSLEWNGVRIPVGSVTATRVVAQAPTQAEVGSARVAIRTASTLSNAASLQVNVAAPVIYTEPGTRRAVARFADENTLILQAAGLGVVSPALRDGEPSPEDPLAVPVLPITAAIASTDAEVIGASLIPGSVGLAEVKIRIPAGAEPGTEVPVVLRVAGQESNVATVALR